ncbi:MAG: ATP-dependent RNA helicase CshA [Fimbriimonadaceae bacterium]|nr:ATP-dependent RNA helicase CshA [Fimbriimonadaceae bacterium]
MQSLQLRGFEALQLSARNLRRLHRIDIVTPTPIQEKAIPIALAGSDLIGIAQTGTGKTLAFALPIVERLQRDEVALVLAPTRELAEQIFETFRSLETECALVVGGASMNRQIAMLRKKPAVIVATPGRLKDHLFKKTVSLKNVKIAVLDEADRMLDMGFAPAIQRILDETPTSRQTLLFSATMPKGILELAQRYLRSPQSVEVERSHDTAALIEHEMVFIPQADKSELLVSLLNSSRGTVLVFARTRHGVRKLTKSVRGRGHKAAELHSDRTLAQRREALHGFKQGQYRVLVATDIAARGIDVKDISLVINYDLPENPEDYVHRAGRTGRAGAKGRSITLAHPEQAKDVREIERILGASIPISELSTVRPAQPQSAPARANQRRGGSVRRFGRIGRPKR